MSTIDEIRVSSDSSPEQIKADATRLVNEQGWAVCHEGRGLERSFKFKGFKAAWDFMNHIAAECKKQKHHPEWSNIYNQTKIRWTTHSPEGLSRKDTHMAQFCDEAAKIYGEIEQKPEEQQAGDWESNARNCCSRPQKG